MNYNIKNLLLFLLFLLNLIFIVKISNMKRLFRNVNDATKSRISQKLKGRSMSDSHRQAISDSMKAYWATIPYRPTESNNESKKPKNNETSM